MAHRRLSPGAAHAEHAAGPAPALPRHSNILPPARSPRMDGEAWRNGRAPPAHWSPEEFTRLPPGTSLPSILPPAGGPAGRIGATIDDHRDAHRLHAMRLLSMTGAPPLPPGHPLYAGDSTLGVLREENGRLKAENTRLRAELERRSGGRADGPRPA